MSKSAGQLRMQLDAIVSNVGNVPGLVRCRSTALLSQRQLATKAGVSHVTIAGLEDGQDAHARTIRKIGSRVPVERIPPKIRPGSCLEAASTVTLEPAPARQRPARSAGHCSPGAPSAGTPGPDTATQSRNTRAAQLGYIAGRVCHPHTQCGALMNTLSRPGESPR
jgi:hypothetical protein